MTKTAERFQNLISIVERLRSAQGCPWDREQTKESLRTYLIEEVYEVIEAIDQDDPEALQEELGDLLFHILFLSHMAKEQGTFDISGVIDQISKKMIHRHPHVFAEEDASTSREVERNWVDLKEREKNQRRSILDGIPDHLPALLRAYRITERASRVGFDWERADDVFKKLEEEIEELKEVLSLEDHQRISDEMGDLIFVLVNMARLKGINPEDALRWTNRKFARRFQYVERRLAASQRSLRDTPLKEMNRLWEEAKERE
jgi:MazG family protein